MTETASRLRLYPDGTYKFALITGSVDEVDEGKWHIDAAAVVLNSTASSAAPSLAFIRSSREAFPGVRISFEGADASKVTDAVHGVLHVKGRAISANEIYGTYLQSRIAMPPIEKVSLVFIGALRAYPVYDHKPTDPTHNHFVFQPILGDYGLVRFNAARLRIGNAELFLPSSAMQREFRYVRLTGW